jgi:hypothetical protein
MANIRRKSTEQKRVKGDDARKETAATPKRKRIPVTGLERNRLTTTGTDPNFHYCWVSDIDNRLVQYQESGYTFVDHAVTVGDDLLHADQEGRIKRRVGKKADGSPEMGYLMRIKREWYEEDMAAYAETVNATEAEIYRELNDGSDGRYGKVDIGHGGKRRR